MAKTIEKKALRMLIAEGEIEEAIKQMLVFTEATKLDELHNQIILVSSDYQAYEAEERSGASSQDALRQYRNKITANLLGIISDLDERTGQPKLKGMTEAVLKRWIFLMLFVGKIALIYLAMFHWKTGGLNKEQAFSVIGYLVPLFVAYLSAIIGEYAKNPHQEVGQIKVVQKTLVWISFSIIPLYVLAFWTIIGWGASGTIEKDEMMTWMTIAESGLGVYVGTIVFELFKPKTK